MRGRPRVGPPTWACPRAACGPAKPGRPLHRPPGPLSWPIAQWRAGGVLDHGDQPAQPGPRREVGVEAGEIEPTRSRLTLRPGRPATALRSVPPEPGSVASH
jgi:hypothetical protein